MLTEHDTYVGYDNDNYTVLSIIKTDSHTMEEEDGDVAWRAIIRTVEVPNESFSN